MTPWFAKLCGREESFAKNLGGFLRVESPKYQLAVLCKQPQILVTRSRDIGRVSFHKSLPVNDDHSHLLPKVITSRSLLTEQPWLKSVASRLPIYSIFVQHLSSSCFSPLFLHLFSCFFYLLSLLNQILKTRSKREVR